jgi:hypothetical protein
MIDYNLVRGMLIDGQVAACTKFNLRSRPVYLDLSDMSVPPVQVIGQHRNLEHKCMNECFSAQICQERQLCNCLQRQ